MSNIPEHHPGQVEKNKQAVAVFFESFLMDSKDHYYEKYYPPGELFVKYCSYVKQRKKDDTSIVRKMIFDAKIYQFHDQFLLLDKDAFDYLKSFVKDSTTIIFYICFTPECTVVFNLSDLEAQKKIRFEPSKKVSGKFVSVLKLGQGSIYKHIYKPGAVPTPPMVENTQQTTKTHSTSVQPEAFPIEEKEEVPGEELFKAEDDILPETPTKKKVNGDKYFDIENNVWRDKNDQILIESAAEMRNWPMSLKQEYSDRHFMLLHLDKPAIDEMITLHGSVNAATKALRLKQSESVVNKPGKKK